MFCKFDNESLSKATVSELSLLNSVFGFYVICHDGKVVEHDYETLEQHAIKTN